MLDKLNVGVPPKNRVPIYFKMVHDGRAYWSPILIAGLVVGLLYTEQS